MGDDNFEFDGSLKQLYFKFDKLCRACGLTKLTSDFYTIRDYAKLGMTSYPSARCKPCHNEKTAENQRVRRAARKLDKKFIPPLFRRWEGSGSKDRALPAELTEVTR